MKDVGTINSCTDIGCATYKLHLCKIAAIDTDKVTTSVILKCIGAASRHSALVTFKLEKNKWHWISNMTLTMHSLSRWSLYRTLRKMEFGIFHVWETGYTSLASPCRVIGHIPKQNYQMHEHWSQPTAIDNSWANWFQLWWISMWLSIALMSAEKTSLSPIYLLL